MKKWVFLGLVIFLGWGVMGKVRADGMVIYPPIKPVYETGQKAVIWWGGKRETLVLSTTFRGNAEDFAWVIPVPSKPDVNAGKDELFTALNDYTRPLYKGINPVPMYGGVEMSSVELQAPAVTVVETKKIDIYDIAVLEATGGKALREWLTTNGYDYPTNRDFLLQYYINKNWYFVAAKVSTEALGYVGSELLEGHATPLSISFDSAAPIYPLKISGPGSKYNEADKIAAFGFEQLSGGWMPMTGISNDQAWQGNYSLKVVAGNNGVSTSPRIYRSITGFKTGVRYVFSAYVYSGGATGNARLRVSGGGVQVESDPVDLEKAKGWVRLELPFVAASDGTYSFYLMGDGMKTDNVFYWDGVQIEKGDKPTAFTSEVMPETGMNLLNQSIGIQLYVFTASHKQTVPGFTAEYAGYASAKDIQSLAYNDDGTPWMKTTKKMYLTKLTRNMTQAQMTDDLVIRDSSDNNPVGSGAGGIGGWWKVGLILGVPILAEIIVVAYFWYSKSAKKMEVKA